MSLATIHRLVISSCRDKIAIDARWRIVSSLSIIKRNNTAVMQTDTCMNHNRFFHNSIIRSQKNQLKESGTAIENISALQIENRPSRRNRTIINNDKIPKPNTWNVKALATAEEYNLEALAYGLLNQQLYIPSKISTSANSFVPDVIHAIAKYEIEQEPREIFFFREGSIVMWNISDLESGNLLQFLKRYEQNRYMEEMVHTETELMNYTHADSGKSHLKDGDIVLAEGAGNLDKYTFSNAMVQSVKLGIWEAALNRYVDSIEFVTEDLKTGRKLQMTQQEVLRKQGELFALRHRINLSSDLLDTPDFYWDRDDLENLYQQICGYFSIAKRTRVMNERLNHCLELVSILSSHLSDRHHVRLEWMIIILIMVEVAFEILHYIDRYLVK